jgi:NitT/TauT family transport system permease protein
MLALWELACRLFAIPAYLVPAPSAIFVDTLQMASPVAVHTLATTRTVLLGFLASMVVSLPLAVLITASPVLANAIYPLLVLTQSIPKVALAPILVVIFGSNELPRVVVTFLVAFFPLVLSIAAGIAAVPPAERAAGKNCGVSACPTPCPSCSAGSRPPSRCRWSARWSASSSTPIVASAT